MSQVIAMQTAKPATKVCISFAQKRLGVQLTSPDRHILGPESRDIVSLLTTVSSTA